MPHAIQNLAHGIGDFVFNSAGDHNDSLYFSVFSRTMVGYIALVAALVLLAGGVAGRRRRSRVGGAQ